MARKKKGVVYSEKAIEIRKKRKKETLQKFVIRGLLVVLVYLLVGLASSASGFLLERTTVSGAETTDEIAIIQTANETLAGNFLLIFPKKNIFFFSRHNLKKVLLQKFPRLSSVEIQLDGKTLALTVTERSGEYLWCGGTRSDMEKSAGLSVCYFADDRGYIFDRSPYFSGTVFFKFFGGPSVEDFSSPIGDFIAPAEEFSEIIKFKEFLLTLDIKSATFFLGSDGVYELYLQDVKVPEETPKLVFNAHDDFETILTHLTTALDAEPLKTRFEEDFDDLLYIDLRFEDQVVYKFR